MKLKYILSLLLVMGSSMTFSSFGRCRRTYRSCRSNCVRPCRPCLPYGYGYGWGGFSPWFGYSPYYYGGWGYPRFGFNIFL